MRFSKKVTFEATPTLRRYNPESGAHEGAGQQTKDRFAYVYYRVISEEMAERMGVRKKQMVVVTRGRLDKVSQIVIVDGIRFRVSDRGADHNKAWYHVELDLTGGMPHVS